MKAPVFMVVMALVMASCSKTSQSFVNNSPLGASGHFVEYTIQKSNQFCDGNSYKAIELTEMKFVARFDSTAIYQTQSVENQYDINKLYGFSDNNSDHHQYSARFGWRWSDNALRLFAYVYNKGLVTSKELATIMIGAEVNCSIKVGGENYLFTVDGFTTTMPRMSTTERAKGYQLYPYFGGDELAPHEINVWIKNLD